MSRAKRIHSLFILIAFILTLFNGIALPGSSADALISVNIQKDENLQDRITDTTVTLEWNQVFGAKSYRISYQDYADDDIGVAKSVYTDAGNTSYEITGLRTDIIYDFILEAMSDVDGQGAVLASDSIKVLTAITFNSSNLTDVVIQNNYDRETGVRPAIKLDWVIPKIWNGSQFDYIDSGLVDYKVTVGVSKAATDAGVYNIKYSGISYEVYKENLPSDVPLSYAPLTMDGGKISYEWRYWDPVNDIVNDAAIKPGTVYYMKILPQFSSLLGKARYRISQLKNGYAYTPLHIKVGKDSNNNIVCTIYRINYDTNNGKNKINFKYEVYSSPDSGMASPSLEGYEFEQYGDSTLPLEIFIPQKDSTSTFYYMVLAKSDGLDSISSPIVDYNMASDAGRPPIPQNVAAYNITMVKGDVNGESIKSANVTLRFDLPNDFDNMKSNLDFHILLSSAQTDAVDSQGNYYKEIIGDNEYDIKYRLVKVVNGSSSNIDTSEPGYIKYTLNGLDLFTEDDGTPIANPDDYPAQLQMNKVYYLKIFSEKIDIGAVSDYSLPVSFTTPDNELRKPPVPEMFNVNQVDSDEISLAWQKTIINPEDYDADGQNYSVYYELYMNDTISKNTDGSYIKPFVFLGSTENPNHVLFTVGTGINNNVRYAQIAQFTGNDEVTQRFGNGIKANTSYYFLIRTKLVIDGQDEPLYSNFSGIVPVTTPKDEITEPDDSEYIPIAPSDFSIQLDSNGNRKVDSYSAEFTWTEQQDDVRYRIIRTLNPINANDDLDTLQSAQDYELTQYLIPESMEPDSVNKYVYRIEELWPNTVYYFSLRAERDVSIDNTTDVVCSQWITIPVTTLMLEAPEAFSVMRDTTYDKYEELKVSWRTKEHFEPEIWIKTDSDIDYSLWDDVEITNDKPASMQGTSYQMSYAVISGLKSNTKYYVKVRNRISRIVDGNTIYDYSKFVGPLNSRTEFRQSDYDANQKDKDEEAAFNEEAQKLNRTIYWVMINSESTTKIKLKEKKTLDAISNVNTTKFVVDMSSLSNDSDEKVIYIPFKVFEHINSKNKLLSIKDGFGEILFRPRTIDLSQKEISRIKNEMKDEDSDVKDIFVRINIEKIKPESASIPSAMKDNLTSSVISFSIDALGMSDTDQNFENAASSELAELLEEKLEDLRDESDSDKDTAEELDELIKEYLDECQEDFGDFLEDEIEDMIEEDETMTELTNAVQIKLVYNSGMTQTQQTVYQYIDNKWSKIPTQINTLNKTAVFDQIRPSTTAVFKTTSISSTSASFSKQFQDLDSRYGISEVMLTNGTYNGQDNITFRQIIGTAGKILGVDTAYDTQDITMQVSKKLGLDSRFSSLAQEHKLSREEMAYIALKLYSAKTGVGLDKLRPSKAINLADAQQINKQYYNAVVMAVDLKIISPDSSNKILPKITVSNDNSMLMIKKVLDLAGEF